MSAGRSTLVLRARVCMEKADGDRVDAKTAKLLADRCEFVFDERNEDRAIREDALRHPRKLSDRGTSGSGCPTGRIMYMLQRSAPGSGVRP